MIKCIAIDDEPIALSIIQEYCKRYGDIELQCFTSPVAGMECIMAEKPDIVFLDIEMNSYNGVTLAKELPESTCLIFTTAYAQYALDGFNVNATDFLHKPFFYPRFEQALKKAMLFINAKTGNTNSRRTITLKADHKTIIIGIDDIDYIEAMDNYVKIFRHEQPTVISQVTMKEMETLIPSGKFIRVHRSFIVSLDSIEKFSNRRIFLKNYTHPIPVGRTYIDSFNNLYDTFKQHNSNNK